MRAFRITPTAARDLKAITRYTLKTWGREQNRVYIAALKQCMGWLAENPNIGKSRSDLRDGYHCYPVGEHVIFYIIYDDRIDVIAILHRHMGVTKHLHD